MTTQFKYLWIISTIFFFMNDVRSRIVVTRWDFDQVEDVEQKVEKSKSCENETITKTDPELINLKPIIGILAQELTYEMNRTLNYTTYIASSYVKFLEAAGARVVPVFIDQPTDYYVNLSSKVNGFLFPGGSLPIDSTSGFGRTGKKILNVVQTSANKGNIIPVWVTCLGFEMLISLLAKQDPRERCHASNFPSNIKFSEDYKNSRLFKNAPDHIIENLSRKNITSNFHNWCITTKNFQEQGANKSLQILSTSFDENGLEYVSTVEHNNLPIYGTQWHPEKAPFEWPVKASHSNIPHGSEAVEASQYMANFFVNEARNNINRFESEIDEKNAIIHNYKEIYLAHINVSYFQQCYFFP